MIDSVESEDSDMKRNSFKRNYELEEKHLLWYLPFLVINPIYAILNRGTAYTSVYKQSPLIHFCFWHFYIFSTFVLPTTTFYPPPVKDNMPWFFANVYNVLSFYITADFLLSKKMPIIQQIRDVQFGCVGSLLSSWCMMFAYVTVDLDGYFVISRCAYHVSTFTILYSFLMTTSYASNVYIDLSSENRKKSKLFIGILHVILGGIIGYLSTRITFNITICLLLVILSFLFSIYLYNYLTVNSYLLCEHRWYRWEFQESRGIICHVIRRRRHLSNPSEILNSLSSENGYFQYEDDIQLDQKYYNEYLKH
ncbi:hypothetical protein CRE_13923 [Caenorhabditis remanei]|uniref:Uncharacterized protein n=1 Tax=Caenorhabditis remanei TaxID=31234 RepID=E3M8R5_CAERE|nr:hypothetical protein CRE_13923 [Caenorhabditis remanei]